MNMKIFQIKEQETFLRAIRNVRLFILMPFFFFFIPENPHLKISNTVFLNYLPATAGKQ